MKSEQREWYQHGLGLLVAIFFLPFFAIWYIWAKSNWSKTVKWSLTAVIAVLFIIITASDNSPSKQTSSNNNNNGSSATPAKITPTAQEKLNYEIVSDASQNSLTKLVIYTSEKDDQKLIAINDELLNKYKPNHSNIYFDYFNDKDIAKTYFDKQLDDSVSDSEKDAMFTHYIANMKFNLSSGLKTFSKNVNGDWQPLKNY